MFSKLAPFFALGALAALTGVGVFVLAGLATARSGFEFMNVRTASALIADYKLDPERRFAPLNAGIIEDAANDRAADPNATGPQLTSRLAPGLLDGGPGAAASLGALAAAPAGTNPSSGSRTNAPVPTSTPRPGNSLPGASATPGGSTAAATATPTTGPGTPTVTPRPPTATPSSGTSQPATATPPPPTSTPAPPTATPVLPTATPVPPTPTPTPFCILIICLP